jgi:hypothetical protein
MVEVPPLSQSVATPVSPCPAAAAAPTGHADDQADVL